MYFIDEIKTYSSVNKKGKVIQSFVEPFKQVLLKSDNTLDNFVGQLKTVIKQANEDYPRSQPLTLTEYNNEFHGGNRQLTVWVENNSDKIVCTIGLKKVIKIID
jgi:hypothetical protein